MWRHNINKIEKAMPRAGMIDIMFFNPFKVSVVWTSLGVKSMKVSKIPKIKLFGKKPRTYGKELPNIAQLDPPNLTNLGKKLAGF